MIDAKLLEEINDDLRREEVPHARRPFEAIMRASKRLGISISMRSKESDTVFKWFKEREKPGSGAVGGVYKSAFYFDSEFWAVDIPIAYGTVSIGPFDYIRDMPEETIDLLAKTWGAQYLVFWADCADYGMGFDELCRNKDLDQFGIELLNAADQELRNTILLLLETRPKSRAILTARMATEMFIKSFLALSRGLSHEEATSIGHNLEAGLKEFISVSGMTNWQPIVEKLKVFPPVADRYREQSVSNSALADALSIAQSLGAVTTREFTNRRIIEQIMPQIEQYFGDSGALGL